jgi:predicted Zn-dependent protease with MMP-like domain
MVSRTRGTLVVFSVAPDMFESLVADALDDLPERFRDALDNIEVLVEDFPDPYTLHLARIRSPYGLLGFYHGVPLTERTTHYGMISPDRISIYRKPIEAQSNSMEELREMVVRVVRHEIAHYFGISDDRLREIGAY